MAAVGLAALVALYFFAIGIVDGSVSADNAVAWMVVLIAPVAAIYVARTLAAKSRRRTGTLVLALVGVPAALVGLFILLLMMIDPSWQ